MTLGKLSGWAWQQIDATLERLQTWPTVNFRSVSLVVLDFLTLAWCVTLSYTTGGSGDQGPLNAWLAFLAGMHGFNLGAYISKRTTSRDGNVDEDTVSGTQPSAR